MASAPAVDAEDARVSMNEIRRVLGAVHVELLIRNTWGLAVARDRARSCTIRPEQTRPAYEALVEHMVTTELTA